MSENRNVRASERGPKDKDEARFVEKKPDKPKRDKPTKEEKDVEKEQKVITRSQMKDQFPNLEEVPDVIITEDGEFVVVDDPAEDEEKA